MPVIRARPARISPAASNSARSGPAGVLAMAGVIVVMPSSSRFGSRSSSPARNRALARLVRRAGSMFSARATAGSAVRASSMARCRSVPSPSSSNRSCRPGRPGRPGRRRGPGRCGRARPWPARSPGPASGARGRAGSAGSRWPRRWPARYRSTARRRQDRRQRPVDGVDGLVQPPAVDIVRREQQLGQRVPAQRTLQRRSGRRERRPGPRSPPADRRAVLAGAEQVLKPRQGQRRRRPAREHRIGPGREGLVQLIARSRSGRAWCVRL